MTRAKTLQLGAVLPLAALVPLALLFAPPGEAGAGNGPSCDGEPADVVLEGSGDTYFGDSSDEVVVGTEGNDEIRTRAGHDTVCGLGGQDVIVTGAQGDELFGDDGADFLKGRNGRDDMFGGESTDRGNAFDDDYCMGGNPRPDQKGAADFAFDCEQVFSAIAVEN